MTEPELPPLNPVDGPLPPIEWRRVCSVEGCDEKHCARGLCARHYRAAYYAANKERALEVLRRWRQRQAEAS